MTTSRTMVFTNFAEAIVAERGGACGVDRLPLA